MIKAITANAAAAAASSAPANPKFGAPLLNALTAGGPVSGEPSARSLFWPTSVKPGMIRNSGCLTD